MLSKPQCPDSRIILHLVIVFMPFPQTSTSDLAVTPQVGLPSRDTALLHSSPPVVCHLLLTGLSTLLSPGGVFPNLSFYYFLYLLVFLKLECELSKGKHCAFYLCSPGDQNSVNIQQMCSKDFAWTQYDFDKQEGIRTF